MRASLWSGQWFDAYERVMGDSSGIRFGFLRDGAREPEWRIFPHQKVDGVGAFGQLTGAATLPVLREKRPPSLLSSVLQCLWHVVKPKPKSRRWRDRRVEGLSRPAEPVAMAWRLFTEEETARALAAAKARGVSLNSSLLHALIETIRPSLEDGPSRATQWMIPVNLRGWVSAPDPAANQTAFLDLVLPDGSDASFIQTKIEKLMRRGMHRAVWWAILLGGWAGEKAMNDFATKELKLGFCRTGVFSNLGAWEAEGPSGGGGWLFSPPCGLTTPFATGAVSWRRRLGLMMQLHPSLVAHASKLEGWMDEWKRRALA